MIDLEQRIHRTLRTLPIGPRRAQPEHFVMPRLLCRFADRHVLPIIRASDVDAAGDHAERTVCALCHVDRVHVGTGGGQGGQGPHLVRPGPRRGHRTGAVPRRPAHPSQASVPKPLDEPRPAGWRVRFVDRRVPCSVRGGAAVGGRGSRAAPSGCCSNAATSWSGVGRKPLPGRGPRVLDCACGEGVTDWKRIRSTWAAADHDVVPCRECGSLPAASRATPTSAS